MTFVKKIYPFLTKPREKATSILIDNATLKPNPSDINTIATIPLFHNPQTSYEHWINFHKQGQSNIIPESEEIPTMQGVQEIVLNSASVCSPTQNLV